MGQIKRDLRITFKDEEDDLKKYLESKSSATCFLKDLARIEMEREKALIASSNTNEVLKKVMELLESNIPQAPVFNLTAQIGGVPVNELVTNGQDIDDDEIDIDDEEPEIDFSDLDI